MNQKPATAVAEASVEAARKPGTIDMAVTPDGIRTCRVTGFADIEGGRPMAMDTLLWMASTGKVVTSAAFMTLVDAGRVSLDDPVWKYLPHFRTLYRARDPEHPGDDVVPLENTVTLRHLLSHTAGLQWLPGFFQHRELTYLSLESQTHVYAASPFLFEPGTSWRYSNAGINTVGRVIEVVTGKSYEDFMDETVFNPLGMADTGYHPTPEQVARRAYGYAYDNETRSWVCSAVTPQMSLIPYDGPNRHAECGGGLFSTAADMARFARMVAGGGVFEGRRIVSEAALREICRRQTPPGAPNEYGLGSQVGTVGHGGAWGTQMRVDLDRREGTLHLVQKAGKWPEDTPGEEQVGTRITHE
jgi:CubicO group peptidase (beta-lactamase class C family)